MSIRAKTFNASQLIEQFKQLEDSRKKESSRWGKNFKYLTIDSETQEITITTTKSRKVFKELGKIFDEATLNGTEQEIAQLKNLIKSHQDYIKNKKNCFFKSSEKAVGQMLKCTNLHLPRNQPVEIRFYEEDDQLKLEEKLKEIKNLKRLIRYSPEKLTFASPGLLESKEERRLKFLEKSSRVFS